MVSEATSIVIQIPESQFRRGIHTRIRYYGSLGESLMIKEFGDNAITEADLRPCGTAECTASESIGDFQVYTPVSGTMQVLASSEEMQQPASTNMGLEKIEDRRAYINLFTGCRSKHRRDARRSPLRSSETLNFHELKCWRPR